MKLGLALAQNKELAQKKTVSTQVLRVNIFLKKKKDRRSYPIYPV